MSLQLTILTIDINEMTSSPMVEVFNQDVVTIGRKASVNDVVLNRPEISGRHLQIRVDRTQEKERIFVMDFGSLNGTTIEGKMLEPNIERELHQGQRIGVGSYIIRPLVIEDDKSLQKEEQVVNHSSKGRDSTIIGDSGSDDSIGSSAKYFEMIGDFDNDSENSGNDSIFGSKYTDEEIENDSHFSIHTNDDTSHKVVGSGSSYISNYEDEYEDVHEDERGISDELFDPMERGMEDIDNNYKDNGSFENDDIVEDKSNNDFEENDEIIEEDNFVEKKDFVEEDDEIIEEANFVSKEDLIGEENDFDYEEDSEDSSPIFHRNKYTVKDVVGTCEVEFDFEGIELFSIRGKVVHNGEPFAGVKIDVGELGSVVSDEQGEFVINDIEEGSKYHVDPSMNKFVFECERGVNEGTLNNDVDLVFQAKQVCIIEGEVKSRKGKPLANVKIDGDVLGTTTTNEVGYFVFKNVLEGTPYKLTLKKDKYKILPFDDSGVVTGDVLLNITANKLLKIDGYVRRKGVPIEGVRVDAGSIGSTVTDQNGYYCFDNIPEGTEYEITLSKEGYKFGRSKK